MNSLEWRDQKTRADEVRDKEAIGQNLGFALREVGRHWRVERKKKRDVRNLCLLKETNILPP